MHRKFGKNRARGFGDILAERPTDKLTDRHTDTDVLITILPTAPSGDVILK